MHRTEHLHVVIAKKVKLEGEKTFLEFSELQGRNNKNGTCLASLRYCFLLAMVKAKKTKP